MGVICLFAESKIKFLSSGYHTIPVILFFLVETETSLFVSLLVISPQTAKDMQKVKSVFFLY